MTFFHFFLSIFFGLGLAAIKWSNTIRHNLNKYMTVFCWISNADYGLGQLLPNGKVLQITFFHLFYSNLYPFSCFYPQRSHLALHNLNTYLRSSTTQSTTTTIATTTTTITTTSTEVSTSTEDPGYSYLPPEPELPPSLYGAPPEPQLPTSLYGAPPPTAELPPSLYGAPPLTSVR